MDEKLAKYLFDEISHTQIALLKFRAFFAAVRVHPELNWDEFETMGDVDYRANVIEALRARAAHAGVSLDGLLD